jgi:hypothetical protein
VGEEIGSGVAMLFKRRENNSREEEAKRNLGELGL